MINPKNARHTKTFITSLTKLHHKSDTLKTLTAIERSLQSPDPIERKKGERKACNLAQRALHDYIHHANKKAAAPLPAIHIPWSPEYKLAQQHLRNVSKEARENSSNEKLQQQRQNVSTETSKVQLQSTEKLSLQRE